VSAVRRTSVVIPARNEGARIGRLVAAVLAQRPAGEELEVLVVDDGSTDDTGAAAAAVGARVLAIPRQPSGGNPAAARNQGAAAATGDLLVFLDADCFPGDGWLRTLLAGHDAGEVVVGGAFDAAPGLPASARCDYYTGRYHVHSRRPAGVVPNHPPGNLSVRRELFLSTVGFTEAQPVAYAHEELAWQAELRRAGHRIAFAPAAVVYHRNRPGVANLLRRNYRWAYSAIGSKAEAGAARLRWVYRFPRLLAVAAVPIALLQTAYILLCWARAGVFEPLLMLPWMLAAGVAYGAGMASGGVRWLRSRAHPAPVYRPRWE
jgi:glycosyltransferase involved in cell wall biosynthesis